MAEEPHRVRHLSGRVLHVPDHRAGHRHPDFRRDLPLAVDRPDQGAPPREGSQPMTRFLPPLVLATLMILSAVPQSEAASTEGPASTLAAVCVRYYGALQKERYEEALGLLHERLRRSEEHTSELQSRPHLVCRLLLEKKKEIIQSEFT